MQVIFETLNESIYQQTSFIKTKQLTEIQKNILDRAKELPDYFASSFLKKHEKEAMSATVELSLASAGLLLNRIHVYKKQTPAFFYDQLELSLADFIHFLSRNFPAYFDYRLPMPESLWLPIADRFNQQLDQFRKLGLEPSLLQVIADELPVNSATQTRDYAQGFYWQQLTAALQQIKQEGRLLTNAVLETLISNNFNAEHFMHYMIEWCEGGETAEDSPEQFWIGVLKLINRIPLIPNMRLQEDNQDCKKMLTKAVTHELALLESAAAGQASGPKINTALSVGQFATLIRLMVDAGIIVPENVSSLTRFFGKHFRTSRKDEIAEANLYRKYYQTDQGTANIVRSYLLEMMNRLKQL